MLPILISVSLAPGSYLFCALAVVAVIAAAAATRKKQKSPSHELASFSPAWRLILIECRKSRTGAQAWAIRLSVVTRQQGK
jgi:hypothetical protein